MIEIKPGLSLPEDEIKLTFARSGGPGGQNVNKVNTKVMLWFDVKGSLTLSEEQKKTVLQRLGNRISRDGVLQVVSMRFRTQKANREEALRRFAALLASALYVKPRRRKTRIPRRAKEVRLQSKKRKSTLKLSRSRKSWSGNSD